MQELKEMEDEPDVVTDYVSLLRSQVEYKVSLSSLGKVIVGATVDGIGNVGADRCAASVYLVFDLAFPSQT